MIANHSDEVGHVHRGRITCVAWEAHNVVMLRLCSEAVWLLTLCFMLYHYYCNFRHNTDLFYFFIYVLKVFIFSCQKFGLYLIHFSSVPTPANRTLPYYFCLIVSAMWITSPFYIIRFLDQRERICYLGVTRDQCTKPVSGLYKKDICCCSVGAAWGRPCEECPLKDTSKMSC